MFLQKRRDFIVRSATLLIGSYLTTLHFLPLISSAKKKERITYRILYVGGPNASDSNPGTSAAPFAKIQVAANIATPGTEIRIRDGIYRETVAPAISGTEEEPIIFTADTRPDGSLCEPVISGANLVETPWTLADHVNLPNVDATTKPIYETNIDLPADGYLDVVTSNTTLAANQVFVRSKMMTEARWPKVGNPDDPMGGNQTEDLAYPDNPKDNGWCRVITRAEDWGTYNVSFSDASETCTLTDSVMPDIPGGWTGGRIKLLIGFIPSDHPITGSNSTSITWDPDEQDSGYAYPEKKGIVGTGAYRPAAFAAAQNDGYTGTLEDWLSLPLSNQWRGPYLEQVPQGSDFRYYLFGRIGALTAEKEWFYEDGKLYMWAPGGGVPENVEYKARNYGFNLVGRSDIHIKNLNFFACEIRTNPTGTMWPSNASNWPEAQAAAAALGGGVVAGAPPWASTDPGAALIPANRILVDYCRFKYCNHYQTLPSPVEFNQNERLEISEMRLTGSNTTCQCRYTSAGMTITGDDYTVRNSVFDYASGSALVVTGRNALIQNNYFKDISYTGSWASPVVIGASAYGLKVIGNTSWRTGRGFIHGNGDNVEVAFNDWSEHSKINVDGGGNYTHGRFASPDAADLGNREFHMGKNLLGLRNPWVPNTFNGLTVTEGNGAGAFKNSEWHHNWAHDSRGWHDQFELGGGMYFDGDTDGVSIHHNVFWNNTRDLRAANTMGGSGYDPDNQPLGHHLIYNNTFGTPPEGVDGRVRTGLSTDSKSQYQRDASRWTIDNNIRRTWLQRYTPTPSNTSPGDLFIDEVNNAADPVFLDYDGARSSQPANGKPWLIGLGPDQYPSGLGFQLKPGSPAINRGTLLGTALKPNGERIHDSANIPVTFDDPVNGTNPDAGAYELDGAAVPGAPRYCPDTGAWIPGTTLPQSFIEGQPWERQWDPG